MSSKLMVAAVAVMGLMAWGSAFAGNITIADENGSGTGWYGGQEDQEVEPGCLTGQAWDVEAFYLSGGLTGQLTLVSGFNLITGQQGVASGDIFIDLDGDAQYGTGANAPAVYGPNSVVNDTFGYDLVLDMDFAAGTYVAYDLTTSPALVQVANVTESINWMANPWRYVSGGSAITSGSLAYATFANDAAAAAAGYVDVTGGWHNAATVDLSWLYAYDPSQITVHFTEGCGNDYVIGQASVPEPSTLVLIGLGLGGMIFRKRVRA